MTALASLPAAAPPCVSIAPPPYSAGFLADLSRCEASFLPAALPAARPAARVDTRWYSPSAEGFDVAIAALIEDMQGDYPDDDEDRDERPGLLELAHEVMFRNAGRDNETRGRGPQAHAKDLARAMELLRLLRAELEALR